MGQENFDDFERRAWRQGVWFALMLHGGMAVLLLFGSQWFVEEKALPPVMTVGLASSLPLSQGGKKTKAPVAAKVKGVRQAAPEQKKTKSVPKKKEPDSPKKTIPLASASKKAKKPVETPVREAADPSPQSSNQTNPEPVGDPDGTLRQAQGGTSGGNTQGLSFALGGSGEGQRVEDLPYVAYLESIRYELSQRWARGGLSGGSVTITFQIHRNGTVSDASVQQSSGRSFLDNPALRAVISAQFPPLPQGCPDDYLVLHYTFNYGNAP
jgi:TonB family protein